MLSRHSARPWYRGAPWCKPAPRFGASPASIASFPHSRFLPDLPGSAADPAPAPATTRRRSASPIRPRRKARSAAAASPLPVRSSARPISAGQRSLRRFQQCRLQRAVEAQPFPDCGAPTRRGASSGSGAPTRRGSSSGSGAASGRGVVTRRGVPTRRGAAALRVGQQHLRHHQRHHVDQRRAPLVALVRRELRKQPADRGGHAYGVRGGEHRDPEVRRTDHRVGRLPVPRLAHDHGRRPPPQDWTSVPRRSSGSGAAPRTRTSARRRRRCRRTRTRSAPHRRAPVRRRSPEGAACRRPAAWTCPSPAPRSPG